MEWSVPRRVYGIPRSTTIRIEGNCTSLFIAGYPQAKIWKRSFNKETDFFFLFFKCDIGLVRWLSVEKPVAGPDSLSLIPRTYTVGGE